MHVSKNAAPLHEGLQLAQGSNVHRIPALHFVNVSNLLENHGICVPVYWKIQNVSIIFVRT